MSKVIKTDINEAIARVADWQGKQISVEPVSGGITNPNFKVTVDGKSYFLKIPGDGTDFIDRENCHVANMIASDSGAGAKVCYYYPDTGVEIFEWLDGYRTTRVTDLYDEDICKSGVRAIRSFHNLPGAVLPNSDSIFDQCREMVDRCRVSDYLPPWHDRMQWLMDRIEHAYKVRDFEKKPCHNDFDYRNFMWDDVNKKGKIIDLEYASMNDPMIDLALWMQVVSTDEMDRQAVIEYNGGVYDDVLFARLKLNKITTDIKWCYWSIAQSVTSDVDFDYFGWYGGMAARLQYYFPDPRIDMWLNTLEGRSVWRHKDAWKDA